MKTYTFTLSPERRDFYAAFEPLDLGGRTGFHFFGRPSCDPDADEEFWPFRWMQSAKKTGTKIVYEFELDAVLEKAIRKTCSGSWLIIAKRQPDEKSPAFPSMINPIRVRLEVAP